VAPGGGRAGGHLSAKKGKKVLSKIGRAYGKPAQHQHSYTTTYRTRTATARSTAEHGAKGGGTGWRQGGGRAGGHLSAKKGKKVLSKIGRANQQSTSIATPRHTEPGQLQHSIQHRGAWRQREAVWGGSRRGVRGGAKGGGGASRPGHFSAKKRKKVLGEIGRANQHSTQHQHSYSTTYRTRTATAQHTAPRSMAPRGGEGAGCTKGGHGVAPRGGTGRHQRGNGVAPGGHGAEPGRGGRAGWPFLGKKREKVVGKIGRANQHSTQHSYATTYGTRAATSQHTHRRTWRQWGGMW